MQTLACGLDFRSERISSAESNRLAAVYIQNYFTWGWLLPSRGTAALAAERQHTVRTATPKLCTRRNLRGTNGALPCVVCALSSEKDKQTQN